MILVCYLDAKKYCEFEADEQISDSELNFLIFVKKCLNSLSKKMLGSFFAAIKAESRIDSIVQF